MTGQNGKQDALCAHHRSNEAIDEHKKTELLPIGKQPKPWDRSDVS